jgi:metal-dependent amidase/aminoacylase/carboxypeptidase family protein
LEHLKDDVENEVENRREELVAMSDWLKRNPETGHREYRAAWLLISYLEREGFTVERNVADMETAFRAIIQGKKKRPVVALMAEYDALPGIGHGCGHNIIATSTVGAAVALKELMPLIEGTLVVLGCPAEEEPKLPSFQSPPHPWGGKAILVDKGVFDDVDFAMMIHPAREGFCYMKRSSSIASTGLQVSFMRKPNSLKAVHCAVEKMTSWIDRINNESSDTIRVKLERMEDAEDWKEIIISFRALTVAQVEKLAEEALIEAEKIAEESGVYMHYRYFMKTYADMIWNIPMVEASKNNLIRLGEEPVWEIDRSNLGDEGNVSHIVPTICTWIRTSNNSVIGHSEEFAEATLTHLGHDAIVKGAKTLAMTVIDLFTNKKLVQESISDFISVSKKRAEEIALRNRARAKVLKKR